MISPFVTSSDLGLKASFSFMTSNRFAFLMTKAQKNLVNMGQTEGDKLISVAQVIDRKIAFKDTFVIDIKIL